MTHDLRPGPGWEISGYRISVAEPFEATIQSTQSVAFLISVFASPKTVADAYREFSESAGEVSRSDFAEGVAAMVSEGFLLPYYSDQTASSFPLGSVK